MASHNSFSSKRQYGLASQVSPTRVTRAKKRPLFRWFLVLVLLGMLYKWAEGFWQYPQAVLVLGGATEREVFAAQFAQEHPNLPIWVSSGSNPEYSEWVFSQAGIAADRLHLDYQAVDTVTNFTTLVDTFKAQGIHSVYLITSDYHMRRATVIGEIVLGSRGIDFRPIGVPSTQATEPLNKVVRDAARAVLWVATGDTGSSFASLLGRIGSEEWGVGSEE